MATKLGDAFVEMSAKDSKLVKDLGNAQSKVSKSADAMAKKLAGVGKGMAIAGVAITAALGVIVTKTAAAGDKFDKMSLRTGVSVEALSSLAYAADICGSDIATVEKGIKALTKVMDDASRGMGEGLDAFRELDIAVTDTEGNLRSTVEVLKEAATKIAAIEDPTKQSAYAMDLFGARAGPQLLPLLKMGEAGIEELMKKAEELNITISTESATAAAEFTDRMTDLKGSLAGAGRMIGDALIPVLTPLIEKVTEIVGKIANWVKENPELTATITKIVAAAGALMLVLGPLFIMLPGMVTAFGAVSGAIAAIGTIASGPIGWCIAAVIGLALAWKTNFGGIRDFTLAVVEKVTEALGWLWDKVKWVLEKLGLYKETAEEVTEANAELAISTEEVGGVAAVAADDIDDLADSMEGLEEATEEAGKIIDEFGNFLESFDDWVARLAKEEEERQEEITKKLGEEAEKRKDILEKLADAQKSIAGKVFELTHTAMEVAIKKLDEEKQSYIDLGMSIKEVNEWYDLEIAKLNEANAEKDEAIDKNKDIIETNKKVAESIEPIIEKTKEIGETAKEAGKQISKSFTVITSSIKKATISLNSFTKEAVAAAIANIKMSYYQLLKNLKNSWKQVIMHNSFLAEKIAEKITAINKKMKDEINVILYGWKEYQKILASMEAGGGGVLGFPSYQTGIRYVPQTGLAVVHRGEEINPPGQRSYDQRKSYTSSSSINIMPGAINIITPKFSEADGQEMFGILERQAKMRGLKLVRE